MNTVAVTVTVSSDSSRPTVSTTVTVTVIFGTKKCRVVLSLSYNPAALVSMVLYIGTNETYPRDTKLHSFATGIRQARLDHHLYLKITCAACVSEGGCIYVYQVVPIAQVWLTVTVTVTVISIVP